MESEDVNDLPDAVEGIKTPIQIEEDSDQGAQNELITDTDIDDGKASLSCGGIDAQNQDESQTDDDEVDEEPDDVLDESLTLKPVYSHSSTEIIQTFDFSKKKVDMNQNTVSLQMTPSELTFPEVISVSKINQMKRDPLYTADILVSGGHKFIIDSVLVLQDDSAPLRSKEELLNDLFGQLLVGNNSSASEEDLSGDETSILEQIAARKPYSGRTYLHDPGQGWLSHNFLDLMILELRKLLEAQAQAEQKWSDENATEIQDLGRCVQSVDEVLLYSSKQTRVEVSNSGSEPNLNSGLGGGITSVPVSSLIRENENETTDGSTTDNSKLLNFYPVPSPNEDEGNSGVSKNSLVGGVFQTSTSALKPDKPPSVVHCLAGVQDLPASLNPNISSSRFSYSADKAKLVSMAQQTDAGVVSPRQRTDTLMSPSLSYETKFSPRESYTIAPPTIPDIDVEAGDESDLNPRYFVRKTGEDNEGVSGGNLKPFPVCSTATSTTGIGDISGEKGQDEVEIPALVPVFLKEDRADEVKEVEEKSYESLINELGLSPESFLTASEWVNSFDTTVVSEEGSATEEQKSPDAVPETLGFSNTTIPTETVSLESNESNAQFYDATSFSNMGLGEENSNFIDLMSGHVRPNTEVSEQVVTNNNDSEEFVNVEVIESVSGNLIAGGVKEVNVEEVEEVVDIVHDSNEEGTPTPVPPKTILDYLDEMRRNPEPVLSNSTAIFGTDLSFKTSSELSIPAQNEESKINVEEPEEIETVKQKADDFEGASILEMIAAGVAKEPEAQPKVEEPVVSTVHTKPRAYRSADAKFPLTKPSPSSTTQKENNENLKSKKSALGSSPISKPWLSSPYASSGKGSGKPKPKSGAPKPIAIAKASSPAGASGSVRAETEKSGLGIAPVSGSMGEKTRARKCSGVEKPKTRSKSIRPITQPGPSTNSYQRRRAEKLEKEQNRPATSTTTKKQPERPVWR